MGFVVINISPLEKQEERDLLIATLSGAGFEGFSEERDVLTAYIPSDGFNEEMASQVKAMLPEGAGFSWDKLPDINWNQEWEKNYPPVIIRDQCYIRAPFHPERPEFPWQILIEPKMSFGTAHHETTRLMLEWLLETDVKEKRLLDMGCGTGILAILGLMKGAAAVTAIDNDEWAWRNARDNFRLNGWSEESVFLGDANMIAGKHFDLILANINRNILLEDIPAYSKALAPGGQLFLSGFYTGDRSAILKRAGAFALGESGSKVLHDWMAIKFELNQ